MLIGAKITQQYEQTIKRDLENDLPKILVKSVNVQKSYIDFVNGARLMFRPFDDPDKLRSLNLTMFIIVEASETSAETYQQLKTRLRNSRAFIKDSSGQLVADWRRGIIETNPGAGWIRTDFLLNTNKIQVYGSNLERYAPAINPDPNLSAHITSTDANKYLPPNFIQELISNRPAWWVSKFIYGSFQYSEGLVYPAYSKAIIPWFEPPKRWKRVIACDYGLSDKFAFLAGAVDTDAGVLYIYKNEATNNKSIDDLAMQYYNFVDDIPSGGYYTAPILDPKSGARRDYNKKTLFDHFLDKGIAFQPGHVQLDARIFRLNTYLESGKIKIMDNCTELITELQDYKFPERTLGSSGAYMDKPIDKNNHSINPLTSSGLVQRCTLNNLFNSGEVSQRQS